MDDPGPKKFGGPGTEGADGNEGRPEAGRPAPGRVLVATASSAAVEDAQQLPDSTSPDDNDNSSLAEENHAIVPESTHSVATESGHGSRFSFRW